MEEIIKRFVAWIRIKTKIHLSEISFYFREGEIWWVNLGANVGYEQDGKNENFERPVLILKKFNMHLLWAIPLTTKMKPGNKYYYKYSFDNEEYSAILSQLRTLSSKRLIRRVAVFPAEDFLRVIEEIKKII